MRRWLLAAGALALGMTAHAHLAHDARHEPVVIRAVQRPRLAPPAPTTFDPHEEIARERLAEALGLAASGRHDEALDVYRAVAEELPDQGLPALARHAHLTGNESVKAELLALLGRDDVALSAVTRARTHMALGESDAAIALLRANPYVRDGAAPEGTLLLARLYRNARRDSEREAHLLGALEATRDTRHATMFLDALFAVPAPAVMESPAKLLAALDRGLAGEVPRGARLREFLDGLVLDFQQAPEYFARRDAVLELARAAGPASALFGARVLAREEDHAAALAWFEPLVPRHRDHALYPLLQLERADLLKQLGRIEDANVVLRMVAESESTALTAAQILDSATVAVAAGDDALAARMLDRLEGMRLERHARLRAQTMRLRLAGRAGDIGGIVAAYAACDPATNEHFDLLHDVLFREVAETAQHWELEAAARERLEGDPQAPVHLWRLVAAAARESRRMPNEVEALYRHAAARPGDSEALVALAEVVAPLAAQLVQAPSEVLSAPEGEVERVTRLAELALRELIRVRPYDPAPYVALMEMFRAQGNEAAAEAVPIEAVRGSNNAALIGTAAYVLATNGFPDAALELYDRALEIAPDEMQIRMNRTACLTRLDRKEEAAAFYRTLLIEGHQGRGWHVHELVERYWLLVDDLEGNERAFEAVKSAVEQIAGDWRSGAIEDAAMILLRKGYLDQALHFFGLLTADGNGTGTRNVVAETLAVALHDRGLYDKAEQVLSEALEDEASEEARIGLAQTRCEVLVALGRVDEALAELQRIGREHATDPDALLSLYRAGLLAESHGDAVQAAALYQEFLDSGTLAFGYRREARQRLDALATPATP
ncbi:MAG: tetratricopeptide repeat protein [Candidatus Sumerlaeia bacterium]|nr:tetratricopeptide repeat protein [Candidatus Sumerlaeia bacterium]